MADNAAATPSEKKSRNSYTLEKKLKCIATAQELAEILAGFEIEASDADDTGHVSDVEVVDDESAASGEEDSEPDDENHNLSDDSDF